MNKTDQSLYKVCIAAIRRSVMMDYAHEFQYTDFYPTPSHFAKEFSSRLNITLHNEELCICSTIVDDQSWSVLTTQRVITCIKGVQQEGAIANVTNWTYGGDFKDKSVATIFGMVTLDDHSKVPYMIETGRASMIMIQGIKTLGERFSCTNEQNEKVIRIWQRRDSQ